MQILLKKDPLVTGINYGIFEIFNSQNGSNDLLTKK